MLIAIFAPLIAPYDPEQVLIGIEDVKKRQAPCIYALGCRKTNPSILWALMAMCVMNSAGLFLVHGFP